MERRPRHDHQNTLGDAPAVRPEAARREDREGSWGVHILGLPLAQGNGLPCWKNYYEVRDRMTDDLIASGTARECAEAMGYYKEEAFRRMARNALRGERLTRRVVTMEKRNGLEEACEKCH